MRDKGGKFVKPKRKYTRRKARRVAKLPRVLVLVQAHVKAPYAAVQLQLAGGRVATYTLAGQHKVVK